MMSSVTDSNSSSIKQRFGKAVRRRRRELDLSQEYLAELAGLHRTYISNLERGMINPTLENMERLAQGLEISLTRLFVEYGVEGEDK
ncbi:helix-turn-helix domain protein [Halothece sp. PCC 7418]|uniref:helix-turn-helix domain-containing protein n=1 Tax=Halothece sp. (strain PCC 7418) TaxID=65093 RepID=UPI0002A08595|nr:helix-turn-helix transcriptional regulator [Halothece sp. PCC 7418]AFZ43381.1 helix-turn-helix domain protein [Halothece sp. PCC 7418]